MGATLRPDQMIRLSIAKRKAKEGLKRLENFDYKLLEIPLLAVQAAEVIDWKLRKYVGPLRLRLVELPAHLEREGGLVFQCGEKMMTALGIQLPYELINVELADCINSCLD